MKTSICCTVICWLALSPAISHCAPYQDLDRISNIVDQARNLAESARANSPSAQQQGGTGIYNNPFAAPANTTVPALGTPNVATPNVAIDDTEIRINTGIPGSLVIPRLGGPTQPVAGVGAGSGVATEMGVGKRVESHLATADAYRRYAAAVAAFRNSNYQAAVNEISQVKLPQEQQLALSPFQSLCHFATGNYKKSAAFAYSTAARNALWGWQNLRGFYGNPQSYAVQYQALQTAAKRPDCDASTLFLTGYHHLMLGHREHAVREFNRVLKLLPNDPVIKVLLNVAAQGPPQPMN